MKNRQPVFRIEGRATRNPKVILQCSSCEADIRQIKMDEEIDVRRGYYCKKCDDGLIQLNPSVEKP